MIVVDTSALIALQFGEPGADEFREVLKAESVAVGAPTLLEYYMALPGVTAKPAGWRPARSFSGSIREYSTGRKS